MAARARGASAVDSYTVPDWAERNSRLFKIPPPGFDPSTVKRMSAAQKDGLAATLMFNQLLNAAVGGAEVTHRNGPPSINLPTAPFPASYWRDVSNHGNILASIFSTARAKVGFTPELSGTGFDKDKGEEYFEKLVAMINELHTYTGYVDFMDWTDKSAENNSLDCNRTLSAVSEFAVAVAGLTGGAAEDISARITSLVQASAAYVTQNGSAGNASFAIETVDSSGARDPRQSISYASTYMSRTVNGKSVAEASSIHMIALIYKLNSNAIIAMADHFASNFTVQGARQYCDYINGPLNNFRRTSR